MSEIKFDDKELKKIIKELSKNMPSVKVGILGEDAHRTDGELTNADIGLFHEFGTVNLPERSFLRMPIMEKLGTEIEKFDKQKEVDVLVMAEKIGHAALKVIWEAFDTGGFGAWPKTKKYLRQLKKTGDENKSGKILEDSGQLRSSISYEVEE